MNESGLTQLLHAAYSAQARVEAELSAVGLSWAKLAALQALNEAGGAVVLSQLADRLACVKSNITQLIDRLEADGLVTRAPDPSDRRGRLAVMTAAGRKACEQGTKVQQKTEQELFGTLNAAEIRQLGSLIDKVGRQAE